MRAIHSKIARGLFQLATATLLASACSSEATGPSQADSSQDDGGMTRSDSAVAHGHRVG